MEANALKALTLTQTDDQMAALLGTAQWLQNKKKTALETFRTVKNSNQILRTIRDFEVKGVEKSVLEPVRVDFLQRKAEL